MNKTNDAPVVKPKKKKNYLNNKDMMAELRRCHEADAMTDEFAKMIMLLADRYGGRYEYSDYSPHIEDMKSTAVMNVVRAWRSFDLEKYSNPFAYFTQAIKHTFWQYVSQEKKHRLNRDALLISIGESPSDAYLDDFGKTNAKEHLRELVDQLVQSVMKTGGIEEREDRMLELMGISPARCELDINEFFSGNKRASIAKINEFAEELTQKLDDKLSGKYVR